MQELLEKIEKRRTFAIISHPDAGKTTLTEKLLLYGGAIHLAGTVKARKSNRHAVSDWMDIEKQRGISVTSSVLQFNYAGKCVNILDTPGHQDFSEDTYRTLMAADSAVMLIDCAKGVEPQTKKLFWVCHRRQLPVFTFVNKLDRYGRDPFDLMDEIEQVLGIRAYPINWPIGIDGNYIGVYDRVKKQIELFENDSSHGSKILKSTTGSLDDPEIINAIGEDLYHKLCDDIELLDMAGDEFDMAKVNSGELTPMFFGSAMTNFGVRSFLEKFLELSPMPQPRILQNGDLLSPDNELFSAFVFKIQANMNPAHRDRIAFIKDQIEKVKAVRSLHRSKRKKNNVFEVSLVGYTNAGKSTLLNTLTNSDIYAKDQLFATLDPTTRQLMLPNKQEIIITDTVGFIQRLPHQLIAAFRSTLEVVTEADLLVHVIDVSHELYKEQAAAVHEVLKEIGAETKPVITVYNKIDKLPPDSKLADRLALEEDTVCISAAKKLNLETLQQMIETHLKSKAVEVTLCIPYAETAKAAQLHETANVLEQEYTENGAVMKVILPVEDLEAYNEYILKSE